MTIGTIGWLDLTIEDGEAIRDFYRDVVGWTSEDHDMGGYSDYVMKASDGTPVGGVCHQRGTNADVPGGWMVYITVADIDASVKKVGSLGGKVLVGPKNYGGDGRYCVIQDPSGATMALFQAS